MLTVNFIIVLIWVAWKMLIWGIKAAWGIAKILFTVLFLSLFLFGLVWAGLIYLAIPVLIIVGICALIGGLAEE